MQGRQLAVEIRREKGKGAARRLRSQGMVPAVCYGKGRESFMLKVDPRVLRKSLDEGLRMNTVLSLDIKGIGAPKDPVMVMIKDYQMDTLTDTFIHTDFFVVDDKTPVEVKVPLSLVGTAEGVKAGGFLQPFFFELPVRSLPHKIPVQIEFDVSGMEIGEIARVKDLQTDEDLTVLLDKQQGIASIISGKVRDAQVEAAEGGAEVEGVEGEGEEGAEGEGEGEGAAETEGATS